MARMGLGIRFATDLFAFVRKNPYLYSHDNRSIDDGH